MIANLLREHLLPCLLPAAAAGCLILCAGIFGCSGRPPAKATELDAAVVETYCRLVAEGKYQDAYEQCLTAEYRGDVTAQQFAAAMEKRRAEAGVLQGRKLIYSQTSHNLFSPVREVHLKYELQYPRGPEVQYMILSDADGAFKVKGTYHETAAETLDFLFW
jgi:hypothetical protein